MLYGVTVTPYSHSFFTYLSISCPFVSTPWGSGCFHVCAGQWSSPRVHSQLEISFSLSALSWLWVPTVQSLWDSGPFPVSVRMFMLFMCRPLSAGINRVVPSLPLKAQKVSNSFSLHMVLWLVILINYIWIHDVVSMGYTAPHYIFGDQMASWWLSPCLQLFSSCAQKPFCCSFALRYC